MNDSPARDSPTGPPLRPGQTDFATQTVAPRGRPGPVVAYMPARGIGDVVWHVPALRRIAGLTAERQLVFLTRPTTLAAELLRHDPAIASVAYVPFQGKKHKLREIAAVTAALRRLAPRALWILDQTAQPAFAAWLAGVRERRGTGEGRLLQIAMLSPGPLLPRGGPHRIEKLDRYLDLYGAPPLEPGPLLVVGEAERAAVEALYGHLPRPWIALGLTASHAPKIWPAERFIETAARLAGTGTAFLVGGPGDAALTEGAAEALNAGGAGTRGVAVAGPPLGQLMALFERLDLFVGNDSGPLNVAAGVGAKALGLFGPTPDLAYSGHITCLSAPDRLMASIPVDAVVGRARGMLGGRS